MIVKVFIYCAMERKIIFVIYLFIRGDIWRMVLDFWMKGYMNSSVLLVFDLFYRCII